MNLQHIIGADLSKKSVGLYCHLSASYIRIDNNGSGFKIFIKWLKQQSIDPFETMVVMEHTGLYSWLFEDFLHKHPIAFTKVSALEIKWSQGNTRGKSDKVDARRIAGYGFSKKAILIAEKPVEKELQQLQLL